MGGQGKVICIRKCLNCGIDVEIRNKQRMIQEHIFCSQKCLNEYKRKEREQSPNYFNCICPICGRNFHLKPYQLKKAKHHYCSKKCYIEAKKEYMKGKGNHQYGLKGRKNASWKTDKKVTNCGYIKIRSLDHPFKDYDDCVLEHRLVAEKYLLNDENSIEINGKRYLKPEYVVHHKDFNKQNNEVSNLQVMTLQEHTSLHSKLRVKNKKQKNK